jgi:hypothetical protein
MSGNRDAERLVDLLAESIAAEAASGGFGLGERRLPMRKALSDVMALWPG